MAVPSIETAIFEAIKSRVETLPMKAAYPIVWSDGPSYEPSPSHPYIRATWIPNTNRRLFLSGADPHQRLSILQLDVFGKVSSGAVVAREIAGQVAAWFPADLRMSFNAVTARVVKAADMGPTFVETHIQVPISVSIETFA